MDDDELEIKTLEMCLEVSGKRVKGRHVNQENNEAIINILVQEHLSRVRRFHRVCKNLKIKEDLKFLSRK